MKQVARILSLAFCMLMFSSVFSVPLTTTVSAQPSEEWIARYSGLAGGDAHAAGMVLGSSGNVYVTGHGPRDWCCGEDYLTIAYDLSGNELWVTGYDGPVSGNDLAVDVVVDSSENIYTTGYSLGSGSSVDYATIAIDSSGNELWVARYDGTASMGDRPSAIALDTSGNVYVTGRSQDQSKEYDFATVKYDKTGNELWVARYDGPSGLEDNGADIAVDSQGNVYVTGGSWDDSTAYDWATIAYDSSGNELWVARYNGPANGNDASSIIAVDSAGDIYVAGSSMGNGTSSDFATAKYDSSGNELWVARYDGPMSGADGPMEMVLDSQGNVYATGYSSRTGMRMNYTTLAYDSSGNELWVKEYEGPGEGRDIAHDIAVDVSGNVYVTGWSFGNGTHMDYATIAYDSSGNELWVARYDAGSNSPDHGRYIAVDVSGNVHVTGGSSSYGTESDIVTIKYASGQAPEPTLDIDPDTLNLKSKGRWITAYIELYDGRNVRDIDVSTILLNDTIPAESRPTAIGDYDKDGVPDLMVKFNRNAVQEYIKGLNLSGGVAGRFGYEVTLTLTGMFYDGTVFECSDTIRVLQAERMGVKTSPFSPRTYDGMMKGNPLTDQPVSNVRRNSLPLLRPCLSPFLVPRVR